MKYVELAKNKIFNYVLTGKFEAPSEKWKHEHFFLGEYELFVITEGVLYLSYDGTDYTVNSGDYLLLPPCNAWRNGYKPAYCSFYWLHFSIDSNNCADDFCSIPITGTIPHPERLTVLMKQLQDEVKNRYPAMSLNAMTTSVLMELCGQLTIKSAEDIKSPTHRQLYSDIADYIQQNISKNIKVSDIATHFGYNEKYLSHLFSEITGIPLKQYIMDRKMDTASFMLADSNISISEIAHNLGFTDNHNFSRAYKAIKGLTPTAYRNAFAKRLLYHK